MGTMRRIVLLSLHTHFTVGRYLLLPLSTPASLLVDVPRPTMGIITRFTVGGYSRHSPVSLLVDSYYLTTRFTVGRHPDTGPPNPS